MKRLILIDGNAIVHRAYHALPNFTTSQGEPVGAIYGFVSMLLRVITDLKPEYLVVAFDRPKPTFRQALYVGYQATRPKMDSDLSPQFEGVQKVLESFNIPIFAIDGYEADDVIGTIATQVASLQSTDHSKKEKKAVVGSQKAVDNEIEVIIVSGDRDMLQLVNSHVKVYMPIKGVTEAKMYDSKDVVEKYGLEPQQIVDMKALTGDASDNYPGVSGIGPKTAATLLQKYNTLESIYENLNQLPERTAKALAQGAESAGMGKKLATIVKDVPITLKIEECRYKILDKDRAVKTLQSFEFRTLPNRLLEILGEKVPQETKPQKSKLKIAKSDDKDQLKLV